MKRIHRTWAAPIALALLTGLAGCQEDGDKTPDEMQSAPGEESRMQEQALPEWEENDAGPVGDGAP